MIKNTSDIAFTVFILLVVLLFFVSAVFAPSKHSYETQEWLNSQPAQYQIGFD